MAGRVAVITGGGGLLGPLHGEAIAESGGVPVLVDIEEDRAEERAADIQRRFGTKAHGLQMDVTDEGSVRQATELVEQRWGPIAILVNNAAHDPKVGGTSGENRLTRLEHFPLTQWEQEIAVGLTGAFLCAKVIGAGMAQRGSGVILNISSDLGLIAPDQRLYARPGELEENQPVKPVTYSVIKHAVIGLTRYLATYWAARNVRVNALAPGGVLADQPAEFLRRVEDRIPLGRLAERHEYKGAVAFLCSDASSYMTGAVVVMDGGRSVW